MLPYWYGMKNRSGSASSNSFARRIDPLLPSSAGVNSSAAPYSSSSWRRSILTFSGSTARNRYPRRRASIARAMPVLPLVGSMMIRGVLGKRSPLASASSSIASAMRSLTEPDGLAPSSFAHRRTPGAGPKLGSSTRGVLPIARSIVVGARTASSVILSAAAGNRRQDRDHVALFDARLQTVQVAHVLVVDVDVDEAALGAVPLEQ